MPTTPSAIHTAANHQVLNVISLIDCTAVRCALQGAGIEDLDSQDMAFMKSESSPNGFLGL